MLITTALDIRWQTTNTVGNDISLAWAVCGRAGPRRRGSITGITPLSDYGQFTYQDAYGQLYANEWRWSYGRTVLDLTVIIQQPYVWGEPPAGVFRGKDLYRRGLVTVQRTVIRPTADGYELLAEGVSQYVDYVRASFHCSPLPSDPFLYHFNQGTMEETIGVVTIGPRWADPGVALDAAATWGDVDGNGTVAADTNTLCFIDVWADSTP